MIDCSPMKGVRVDPKAQTVWAQAGVIFSELDRETQVFGLATPGGTVSRTGIAGFTLGGGIGWLSGKYGMACDNLIGADVVTAGGEVLHASEHENTDLLWALRGGGGNFGVVTAFQYRLYPVTQIGVCITLHPAEKAAEAIRFYRSFAESGTEDVVGIAAMMTAPPMPFVPEQMVGTPAIGLIAGYLGPVGEAERVLAPIKEFGSAPVALVMPAPYVFVQQMLDEGAPEGIQNYWTAEYLADLPDPAVEVLVEHGAKMPVGLSMLQVIAIGADAIRAGERSRAFSTRDAGYMVHVIGAWPDVADNERNIAWATQTREALVPYGLGGAYLNFTWDEGLDRVQAAFGPEKYRRWAELKARYDPDNFFHHNQNIRPAGA
jgi:FAD/FMN-containing dehydrogenase